MSRTRIAIKDLVGLEEIAERTETMKATVHKWTLDPEFPRAVYPPEDSQSSGKSRVWVWPDVERWIQTCGKMFRGQVVQAIADGSAEVDEGLGS